MRTAGERPGAPGGSADPMVPRPFRVTRRRGETADTFTLDLVAEDGKPFAFAPGQFNMLYVHGVGEVPISISGDPADGTRLVHTIRAVGKVSAALCAMKRGERLAVRGPYGKPWPTVEAEGHDVVFIAGGVGLAPLRPAILHAIANRHRFGKVIVLYGARSPADMLFAEEVQRWRGLFSMEVDATVDRAGPDWLGRVGVVTKLVERAEFDPAHTLAMICGPEVMMRFSVEMLSRRGVAEDRIYVSMERNMKCAVGFCGHCQWGSAFVCRDGPVFRHDRIAHLNAIREL